MSETAYQDNFRITNDQQAEWAINKIKEAKIDNEKWAAFYAERLAAVKEANAATIAAMEGYLADYFVTVPHKVTKTQESYQLPGGKLVLKAQQPEYDRDEARVIGWCKENGHADCVNVKETLNWAELKKRCQQSGQSMIDPSTGEEIPGITVNERPAKFGVEGI